MSPALPLFMILLSLLGDTILFQDVSDEAGISATHRAIWDEDAPGLYDNGYLAAGSAWADFDNDGWVDVFVSGNLDPNALYRNNGDGTFALSAHSPQLSLPDVPSGGAVWADYDNDGFRDLYVLNMGANRLFRNLGAAGFEDVTRSAGVGDTGKASGAAWGDYDGDGWLDLYVTNWSCIPGCVTKDFSRSRDALYHNNGDGSFTDVSGLLAYEKLLGAGFAASFADVDDDRDLDLYIVNDKAVNAVGNVLWRNDGAGCGGWCFSDISAPSGADTVAHGMGLATGDYDNDGDLDFYFSNMVRSMYLLENQDGSAFVDRTDAAGVAYLTGEAVGWGTAFFDYDNDGWLDLYLAATGISPVFGQAGMHFDYPDMLYHNERDGTFTAVEQARFAAGDQPTMGISTADYDRDGRVDYLLTHWDSGHRLFRNTSALARRNNWITLELRGGNGMDLDAIGARVRVDATDGLSQIREVKSGSSLGAGNELALHFGLANADIERVLVSWLNGDMHEYIGIEANQRCLITPAAINCDAQAAS